MPLTEQLDQLAAFEPAPYPVVSLYLDTRPDHRGRDQYETFTRKELKARSRTYPLNSPERESLDRDIERIVRYLENDRQPSANSIAIFACAAGELFETVQSAGVIPQHALHIGDRPALVSARSPPIPVPKICRRRDRHQSGTYLCVCDRRGRTGSRGQKRQDPRHDAGWMVAGSLSASRRELPRRSRQGGRRSTGSNRARRGNYTSHRVLRRGLVAALARTPPETPRRESGRSHSCRGPCSRSRCSEGVTRGHGSG